MSKVKTLLKASAVGLTVAAAPAAAIVTAMTANDEPVTPPAPVSFSTAFSDDSNLILKNSPDTVTITATAINGNSAETV